MLPSSMLLAVTPTSVAPPLPPAGAGAPALVPPVAPPLVPPVVPPVLPPVVPPVLPPVVPPVVPPARSPVVPPVVSPVTAPVVPPPVPPAELSWAAAAALRVLSSSRAPQALSASARTTTAGTTGDLRMRGTSGIGVRWVRRSGRRTRAGRTGRTRSGRARRGSPRAGSAGRQRRRSRG